MNQSLEFDRRESRPIRIAYVSADFREHPVGHLLVGVIEQHHRPEFEVVGISVGHDDGSPLANRFKEAFDYFIRLRGATSKEICQAMKDLEVDIAVDLGGYTGESRYDAFAHRPAPVQINWLGYPGTMGSDAYDYIIADRIVIPPEFERYYSERVIRLPNSYMPTDSCLKIADTVPSRSESGLPEQGFIFCSFNQTMKFTEAMFSVWMRLLAEVPGSVLWLRGSAELAEKNLRKFAEDRGIDSDRLVFAPRLPRVEDHLARYQLADLFLDTFPYNAHTTAADALFCGLPVLTLAGESFASRVGASLLSTLGLHELITGSFDEYFASAKALCMDPARLAAIRHLLGASERRAALFDTSLFVHGLEAGLRTAHQRRLDSLPPANIDVPTPPPGS